MRTEHDDRLEGKPFRLFEIEADIVGIVRDLLSCFNRRREGTTVAICLSGSGCDCCSWMPNSDDMNFGCDGSREFSSDIAL